MYSSDLTDLTGLPEAPAAGHREATRDRVLQSVLTHGPVSAARVGELLGLTAAAVRRHLDALTEDGLVEVKLVEGSRGAGRPSRRYVVSHRGQAELGDDYLAIASVALQKLGEATGSEGIRQVARDRFAVVERRFRQSIDEHAELQERARTLVRVLDEEGFAASLRQAGLPGGGAAMRAAQVCQGHCPLQELAGRFPQFCEEETALFARLLKVDVRRLSTLPTGGHVCTTHVPLGRHRAGTVESSPIAVPQTTTDPGRG